MQSFRLNVEHEFRIDVDSAAQLYRGSQLLLLQLFDTRESVYYLTVVSETLKPLELGKLGHEAVADQLADISAQLGIRYSEPTARRDTIRLV